MPMTDKPLRFAINLGNAVLTHTRPDGQPGGITVEIARLIAAERGVAATFVTYPTAGQVVEEATQDRWDIAFLAIDPTREAILRFTPSYLTIEGTVLVRADSPWQSVTEMDKPGVVINVGKGAAYDLFLTRTLHHATLNRLPSSQAAIEAFLAGEGEMAAGIRQPLMQAAAQSPAFRVLPDNFGQIFQAICVPHPHDGLFADLCASLARWQADGTLARILAQHLAPA